MDRTRRAARLRRILRAEQLESRSLLASIVGDSPWQNPLEANDLDCDGVVSASDALTAINALNAGGVGELSRIAPPQLQGHIPQAISDFLDADGDGNFSAGDPLAIINALNARRGGLGHDAPDVDQPGMMDEAVELDLNHGGYARVRGVINNTSETEPDVDFFKVTTTKMELNVALFSRGGAVTVAILDATGAEVGSAEVEAGAHRPAKTNLEVTANTTYFFKVTGESGPYALAILNFDDQAFSPEPDSELGDDPHGDTPETATALTLDRGLARVVSHIDTAGDADVFAVEAHEGKLIVNASADFSLEVEISDASGSLGVFNTSERNAIAVNVATGTYNITVTGSNSSDTGVYRLRVGNVPRLHEGDGDHEPPIDHPGRPTPESLFAKVDADGNGSVSKAEFKENVPGGRTRLADHVFASWDTDGDAILSMEEFINGLSTLPPFLPRPADHTPVAPLLTHR